MRPNVRPIEMPYGRVAEKCDLLRIAACKTINRLCSAIGTKPATFGDLDDMVRSNRKMSMGKDYGALPVTDPDEHLIVLSAQPIALYKPHENMLTKLEIVLVIGSVHHPDLYGFASNQYGPKALAVITWPRWWEVDFFCKNGGRTTADLITCAVHELTHLLEPVAAKKYTTGSGHGVKSAYVNQPFEVRALIQMACETVSFRYANDPRVRSAPVSEAIPGILDTHWFYQTWSEGLTDANRNKVYAAVARTLQDRGLI